MNLKYDPVNPAAAVAPHRQAAPVVLNTVKPDKYLFYRPRLDAKRHTICSKKQDCERVAVMANDGKRIVTKTEIRQLEAAGCMN